MAGVPAATVVLNVHSATASPSNCSGVSMITCYFNYNGTDGTDGSVQNFTVPSGVKAIMIDAMGAEGGGPDGGGFGGRARGTITTTPGQVFDIRVGGTSNVLTSVAGGYNGGGASAFNTGNGGGGASDVRPAGGALADRIVTAGGGGGSGDTHLNFAPSMGGAGGGANGGDGTNFCANDDCGHGATDSAGGNGGIDCPASGTGIVGVGGGGCDGGGGGGGWYGGGAGADGFAAGGGSGHVIATATNAFLGAGENHDGNGWVWISYSPNGLASGPVHCFGGTGTIKFSPPLTAAPSTKTVKMTVKASASCDGSLVVGAKAPITNLAVTAKLVLPIGAMCSSQSLDTTKAQKLQLKFRNLNVATGKLKTVAVTNTTVVGLTFNFASGYWQTVDATNTNPKKPFFNQGSLFSFTVAGYSALCGASTFTLANPNLQD
jgi:hypothetical protein